MALVHTPAGEIGWQAADFELEGVDGRTYSLADVKGENGTVVMFICNHCPYVKAQLTEIVREIGELREHGIGAIAVMPNDTEAYPEDRFERMKAVAAEHNFTFPYVIDRSQEVARAYEAVCTPDFFGFDRDLRLKYRGRMVEIRNLKVVENAGRELYDAMLQVAETGEGPAEQIPSMGCSIKWRGN